MKKPYTRGLWGLGYLVFKTQRNPKKPIVIVIVLVLVLVIVSVKVRVSIMSLRLFALSLSLPEFWCAVFFTAALLHFGCSPNGKSVAAAALLPCSALSFACGRRTVPALHFVCSRSFLWYQNGSSLLTIGAAPGRS